MRDHSLAIVIPAYNESATIAGVVAQANAVGDVIVVDDGSQDGTARLARDAGARVVRLGGNSGYEAALNAGVQYAIRNRYEFVMTMDADGQHAIESAEALIRAMGDADVVIGLRHTKQRVVEWCAGLVGKALWGVADPFSGLKLYRLRTCGRFEPFDTKRLVGGEMFVRARRAGLTVVGVPIVTANRADAPRFGTSWRANLRLARATVLLVGIYWGLLR
jgi:glycosyltransferase involved in cell wall biosynthesis